MIVDTSAIIALLLAEPEAASFAEALRGAPSRSLSGGTWVEVSAVLTHRFKPEAFVRLNEIMSILMIDVVPVTPAQAQIGFDAYRRFGRGGQSGAKLNIGDCFAYALAIDTGQPLLFKGDDFIHTDVKRAV